MAQTSSTPVPRSNEYRTPTTDADALWAAIRHTRSKSEDRSTPQALAVGDGGLTISVGTMTIRDPSGADRVRVGLLADDRYGVEVFNPSTGRWGSPII